MDERIVHYWDGYGNLCNTQDGRRNDAKSSAVIFEVTCERCLSNLEKIGKLPTGVGGSNV